MQALALQSKGVIATHFGRLSICVPNSERVQCFVELQFTLNALMEYSLKDMEANVLIPSLEVYIHLCVYCLYWLV